MPPTAKSSKATVTLDADQAEQPERHLFAALSASAQVQKPAQGQTAKTNGGRWRLNAGSVMTTRVYGVNLQHDQYGSYYAPIRLVVDMATAKFAKPVMPALSDHWSNSVIGNWSNNSIEGGQIEGDLSLYEARTPAEAEVLPECVRVKALLEQGHPWQASIGAEPENGLEDYEEIPEGTSLEVNGSKVTADDPEMPTYVLRNAVISEASVCTFGADQNTGPLAAALARRHGRLAASAIGTHPTRAKDSAAMKYNLRALLTMFAAHAALVAESVAAAQDMPEDKQPTPEALQASIKEKVHQVELADEKAKVAERDAEITRLKTEATAGKGKGGKVEASATEAGKAPNFAGGTAEGEGGDAPESLIKAMAQLSQENPKLKGLALRAAALKRWPEFRQSCYGAA